ncbi:MAG: SRPBCC family protein [Pseudomonadota bacterium]
MELKFEISGRINKPVEEVFEAVANPDELSGYFTTGGAQGRLETGATVSWKFHDFPETIPVTVVEVEQNRRIILQWEADDTTGDPDGPYDTTVTMRFEPLEDGRTLVSIAEEGWRRNEAGLRSSYGNCSGWMQMLCAMKGYLEHGVNLREGMFR